MKLNEFMNNEFIQTIKDREQWTLSEQGSKKPLDMNYMIAHANDAEYRPIGASFANNNKPLVTLDRMGHFFSEFLHTDIDKITIPNAAYDLSQLTDDFMVLDIEPTCPDVMKNELLKFPYPYVEKSMSGKGIHAIIPNNMMNTKFEDIRKNASKLQEEHRYYEFLLNHYVTFTGEIIIPTQTGQKMLNPIETYFDRLAEQTQLHNEIKEIALSESVLDMSQIPGIDIIMDIIDNQYSGYYKTKADFNFDESRYEFGFIAYYAKRLEEACSSILLKGNTYTDEQKVGMLYNIVKERIPERPKHNETRRGMPYLLYCCKRVFEYQQ